MGPLRGSSGRFGYGGGLSGPSGDRGERSGDFAVWRQAADGRWWYDWGDGTWPADCWEEIQGKWYFFDPEGYMKTGWFLWEDQWYYCTEKGYMLSDCITEDGYWLGADGAFDTAVERDASGRCDQENKRSCSEAI